MGPWSTLPSPAGLHALCCRGCDPHAQHTNNRGSGPQANLLYVKELARRLKEEGSAVEAFALHPGRGDMRMQPSGGRLAADGRRCWSAQRNRCAEPWRLWVAGVLNSLLR